MRSDVLMLIFLIGAAVSAGYSLGAGVGFTTPSGDIIREYGKDPLDVYCTADKSQLNESAPHQELGFYIRGLRQNHTTIVNSTTIHFHIDAEEMKPVHYVLFCGWGQKEISRMVSNNYVAFGMPPSRIDNFKCISYNNDNLTCTWSAPENSVLVNFSLKYVTRGDVRHCPAIVRDSETKVYSCFWSLQTNPQYRQSADHFKFILLGTNKLGVYTQELDFDHFSMVIPNAPDNLTVRNTTTNSMFLSWAISPTIISLPSGLQFRVMYYCKLGMTDWRVEPIRSFKEKNMMTYNLTNIPYAYNLCDIRVSLRNNRTNDDSMWSHNATINHYTSSTLPGVGPKLHMGSYTPINETTLRIYWHKVPVEYEYGPNLRYNLSLVRGRRDARISEIHTNYAVVSNLMPTENYTFTLWAYNDVGANSERTYITIPALNKRPYHVQELRKIDGANGSFSISWTPIHSMDDKRIENYTVFWCKSISDTAYCSGDWNWIDVPADQTHYVHDKPKSERNTYHVAIAANSAMFSSGMVFSTCNVNWDKIPRINLKNPYELQATSIKLSWEVGCTNEGIGNFTIDYCIVSSTQDDSCADSLKPHMRVVAGNVKEFVVSGLEPYKTYVFGIVPTMKNGERGTRSSPVRASTLEGQPTQATELRISSITNSSLTLSWKAPSNTNGIIKYYRILYNNEEKRTNNSETVIVLNNLISFQLYNISVSACTTVCSIPSETISDRTLMGTPSKIEQPKAQSINASGMTIVWSPPAQPRGPLTYYEVKVDDGEGPTVHPTTDRHYLVKCDKKPSSVSLSVRAWNEDHLTNTVHHGVWSEEFKGSCVAGTPWLIPTLIFIFVIVPAVGWASKWIYVRCRRMQDVEVKLPHTLDHPQWMNSDPIDSKPSKPAADEELLLQTRTDCISTADSSGHGSAHGSLSDTDAAISASSDSGTEQTAELRKRSSNLSKRLSVGSADTVQLSQGENYSRVGTNLHSDSDASSGYTQLPLVFPKYVDAPATHPPENMPPPSGYVSHQSAMMHFLQKPKEEETSIPYVQVADANNLMKTIPAPKIDAGFDKPSYVQVSQVMPKMNKLYEKED